MSLCRIALFACLLLPCAAEPETLYGACVQGAVPGNSWYAAIDNMAFGPVLVQGETLYGGLLPLVLLAQPAPIDSGADSAIIDTIPPVILFPVTDTFTTSRPAITIFITDETGPIDTSALAISLNGAPEDRGSFSLRAIDSLSGLVRHVEIDYTPSNAPAGVNTIQVAVHDGNPENFPDPAASAFGFFVAKTESDPPQVTIHTPVYSLSDNTAFSFAISATDTGSGIQRVLFRYKVGGDRAFRVDTLAKDAGRYSKLFPAGSFTAKGFCFFVEVIDKEGNTTVVPDTAADARNLAVRLSQGIEYARAAGSPFPANRWKMLSLPLEPDQPSLQAMLEPILGLHDKRHWKLVRWLSNGYAPLGTEAFSGEPGKAFFLYVRDTETDFNPGPSASVRIDRPWPMVLPANQWSQIGCPFAFPVRWRNFFASDSAYEAAALPAPLGDTFTDSGYALLDTNPVLFPWQGYWVFNPNATACTLAVHPYEEKNLSRASACTVTEWTLSLSCAPYSQVAIGTARALKKSVPCPPVVHGAPYLYFAPKHLTSAADQGNAVGWTFPGLMVDFNASTSARLTSSFTGPAPETTALVSEEFGYVRFLKQGGRCDIDRPNQEQSVRLTVLSGAVSYVTQRIASLTAAFPSELAVGGNAPNPFNPTTHFSLALPAQANPYQVHIAVYTTKGDLVTQLVNGFRKPGVHEIVWNGRDATEKPVSSGVYLYRVLVYGEEKSLLKSGKMALIK